MFIQFGHNDEKVGTNNYSSPEDYRRNLVQFVDEVRAKQAQPVLFTPVVRRKFDGTQLVPTHGAYPDAARAAARERDVPLVDMERSERRARPAARTRLVARALAAPRRRREPELPERRAGRHALQPGRRTHDGGTRHRCAPLDRARPGDAAAQLPGAAMTAIPVWVAERRRPRVIIVGGGFGGLYAARALKRVDVDVLVLDRTNHHLFQPLLYQVATATLAPTDITAPIRWLLRKQANASVLMETVTHVDVERRVVATSAGREHAYDYLILASGARHAYFNHPEWEPLAPGLKSVDDAIELRRRILTAFERAEATDDAEERAAWLTFVIVGGGPTGVELAGMLPTIARHALVRDFRRIHPSESRVLLLEGGPKILPAYPDALSEHARRDLTNLGVDVRTGALVSDIGPHHVTVGGRAHPRAHDPLGGGECRVSARARICTPDRTVPAASRSSRT